MKNTVIIVGVGGTGGNLAPMLSRFLPEQWQIVLVDGDIVSESNLKRQPYQAFDVGSPKSVALANKLTTATGRDVLAFDKYLSNEKMLSAISKGSNEVILIGCVDNHPARIIMENWFKALKVYKKLYIDSANELSKGEIIFSENGKKLRSDIYPKIKKDKSDNPLDASCEVSIANGNTQQYATNVQAATLVLQLIDDWINLNDIHNTIKSQKRYIQNLIKGIENNKAQIDELPPKDEERIELLEWYEEELNQLKDAKKDLARSELLFKTTKYSANQTIFFDLARKGLKSV